MPRPHEVLMVEDDWCPECHAEHTVEIVALPDDPGPVAICLNCRGGTERGWHPVPGQRDIRAALAAAAS